MRFFRVPSQHGLWGVPGEGPGPKSMSKWRPGHGFSVISGPCFHFLWRHFGIFPVLHELQIDSTRCSVYGCLCLGLGGKPMVDASQMPPRCLPDASQMRPRCLPDAYLLNDSFSVVPLPIIPASWFLSIDFSSICLELIYKATLFESRAGVMLKCSCVYAYVFVPCRLSR